MLTVYPYGADEAQPPILIVHGLFGSGRNWGVIAKRLSDTRRVLCVDMRNHGDSPWKASHTYPDLAGDLAEVIAAHGGLADVVGHSMGGKAAMVLALSTPRAVRRLVVADIAPVAYTHTQQHLIDAMRRLDLSAIATRRDADAQLARHVPEAGVRAFLLQSLDVKGRRWRLNLDVLERDMTAILSFPKVQGAFDGPSLFLSGARSDYVKREDRPTIKALFPQARFAKLPGAGHWLHADKPREFEAALRAFLTPGGAPSSAG
ncbi:Hydrolase, alpha/beta fold protein family [Roseibacterium elongatum DSM 19469]|uniref:Hydrolase, alpha/beta fold protein family n=1 Tax=Roseicyclus elongatus DSM 19469 TaxID=1294273 RepID=W8S1V9_9RHOB|nr:alpha/beta fold hydrolase [Roseibacterium elongatum]AHM04167.1 Hydrolase, alpha/beta fold protein family [Roseibacterium elongatum DSM 19469]